jgi:ribosomal protein S18 acetylase RimI-like enzyme
VTRGLKLRRARLADIDALVALERSFTMDVLSRRSFRRLIAVRSAALIVAEEDSRLSGYALVLFRKTAAVARLYSIVVAPKCRRHGIGAALLAAAERVARGRGCRAMRLEVHERNFKAIARYRKSSYRLTGRLNAYYDDKADALRFEKGLRTASRRG